MRKFTDCDEIFNRDAADRRAEEVHAACLPEATTVTDPRDEEDYAAWCREYENGRWEARLAEEAALDPAPFDPAPTFVEKLYAVANEYLDREDPDLCWLGGQIAKIADRARFLDATSAASFDDREDAARDCAEAGFGI